MAEDSIRTRHIADLTSFDLNRLSKWVNYFLAAEGEVPRAAIIADSSELLTFAEDVGILRWSRIATEISCQFCLDPHACEVVRSSGGGYRYHCLMNGWVEVSADDVELVAFDRTAFIDALATGAELAPRDVRHYADGRLAKLGFVHAPPGSRQDWVLAYADLLEQANVMTSVIDVIASEFPDGPGFVVTPSPIAASLPLPRRYRFVALCDLFVVHGSSLALDRSVVRARLGHRARVAGQPGRPGAKATVQDVWRKMKERHDWPDARRAQAQAIHASWPEDGPPRPALGTIENHIREFENR